MIIGAHSILYSKRPEAPRAAETDEGGQTQEEAITPAVQRGQRSVRLSDDGGTPHITGSAPAGIDLVQKRDDVLAGGPSS